MHHAGAPGHDGPGGSLPHSREAAADPRVLAGGEEAAVHQQDNSQRHAQPDEAENEGRSREGLACGWGTSDCWLGCWFGSCVCH